MIDLTRREMLRLGGLSLGSAIVGPSLFGCYSRFADPPLLSLARPEPGLAVAELRAALAKVSVAERPARVLAYGGSYPGPVIRVRAGETLRLGFTNDLAEETNLHFHGLHVDPAVDDPFLHVHPGERHVYELAIPWDAQGTYWYHPHVHGRVAVQLFAELAGAIVVDPPEEIPGLAAAEDHVLVLKDITLVGEAVAFHTAMDWRGRVALSLVNGQRARSRPRLGCCGCACSTRATRASTACASRVSRCSRSPATAASSSGRWSAAKSSSRRGSAPSCSCPSYAPACSGCATSAAGRRAS
jgi:FtsP/CotA-like multicopper oxidase with cupredoxin domain